jgi:hypothetical protein
MEKEVVKWTTKEGIKIPITEMTNRHLLFAERMIANNIVKYEECIEFYVHPVFGPHGEMAQDSAEREMEEVYDRLFSAHVWSSILKAEIKRRMLTALPHKLHRILPTATLVDDLEIGRIYKLSGGEDA